MATYVIGDIHGCFMTLQQLLLSLDIQPQDKIWCVGDLINRGPYSLETIEWAMSNQDCVQVILGNHELHLLACFFGADTADNDTLNEILSLSRTDRRDILEWIRHQPILHEAIIAEMRVAMVHAGINPRWTWTEVRQRALRIEEALRRDDQLEELAKAHPSRKRKKHIYDKDQQKPLCPSKMKTKGSEKPLWIDDLKWFTRVRTVDLLGEPVGWFKGSPDELYPPLEPWFTLYAKAHQQSTVAQSYPDRLFYGHWAAYGLQKADLYSGLDTGCIWGRHLSAIRVEDDQLYQVHTVEPALIPKHMRSTPKEVYTK